MDLLFELLPVGIRIQWLDLFGGLSVEDFRIQWG
jgi:hypothetical protein